LAALNALDQAAIDRINTLGERLNAGFSNVFKEAGVRGQVSGIGSLNQIHWGDDALCNARDAARAIAGADELPGLVHLELMNRGIYSAKRGMFVISTPMSELEIDTTIDAFKGTLDMLKPYIAERFPQLIAGGKIR